MVFELVADMKLARGAVAQAAAGEVAGSPRRIRRRHGRTAKDTFIDRYGQAAYDMRPGDCLRHVYAMIGKLVRRVYLLSASAEVDASGPGRATVEP